MQKLEITTSGQITKTELETAVKDMSPKAQEAIVDQILERGNSREAVNRQVVFDVLEENKKEKHFK